MENNTVWWKSKTFWGVILAAVSVAANIFTGTPLLSLDQLTNYVNLIVNGVGAGGVLLAMYGRVEAVKSKQGKIEE